MKIIYHCYGSSHSSVVCSGIHLNKLPCDKNPNYSDILNLPRFDKTGQNEIGTIFFMGNDEIDNEVYILGMKHSKQIVLNAIYSIMEIHSLDMENILFVDTLSHVNLITKIGGVLSRRLGLVRLGRPITLKGIIANYYEYVKLVKTVKEKLHY